MFLQCHAVNSDGWLQPMCTVFYFIFSFCSSKELVVFLVNADWRGERDLLFSFDLQNWAHDIYI